MVPVVSDRFARGWRRTTDEQGFTLIELMVVVLVIGILISLALPTFLGARSRAQDQAAKATLRVGLTAGRVIYSTSSARDPNDRYLDATIPELTSVESSVRWQDETTPSLEPTALSKDTSTGVLFLASYSLSGTCFFLRDDPPLDIQFGQMNGAAPADCYAANSSGIAWQPSW